MNIILKKMTELQIKLIEFISKGLRTKEIEKKIGYSVSWIEKEKNFLKDYFEAKTDAELIYKYYYKE